MFIFVHVKELLDFMQATTNRILPRHSELGNKEMNWTQSLTSETLQSSRDSCSVDRDLEPPNLFSPPLERTFLDHRSPVPI